MLGSGLFTQSGLLAFIPAFDMMTVKAAIGRIVVRGANKNPSAAANENALNLREFEYIDWPTPEHDSCCRSQE
jgi:hypothetical protein